MTRRHLATILATPILALSLLWTAPTATATVSPGLCGYASTVGSTRTHTTYTFKRGARVLDYAELRLYSMGSGRYCVVVMSEYKRSIVVGRGFYTRKATGSAWVGCQCGEDLYRGRTYNVFLADVETSRLRGSRLGATLVTAAGNTYTATTRIVSR